MALHKTHYKKKSHTHKNSFKYETKKNSIELSNYVWGKKKDKQKISLKWYIKEKAKAYSPVTKRCIFLSKRKVRYFHILFSKETIGKNNLWRGTFFRNRKITESYISRDSSISKKFPYTLLKILYAQISWTNYFFSENILFKDLELFSQLKKALIWTSFFSTKNQCYNFFQRSLFKFLYAIKNML